jgi:hypothetical protein
MNSFGEDYNCTGYHQVLKKGGISEISAYDLTNVDIIATTPVCKQNDELIKLLCIENVPFLEKITALSKTKAIWQNGRWLLKTSLP